MNRIGNRLHGLWTSFWMKLAGPRGLGRLATRLAVTFVPPYFERHALASLVSKGYYAPTSRIYGDDITLGSNIFIDDRVLIYQGWEGGSVDIEESVHIHRDTIIQTGQKGSVKIGAHTKIQPRCQFSAYKSAIIIGSEVQIAPNCSFFSYNHGIALGLPIRKQPLQSTGKIIVGNESWLGVGAIILDGVVIGEGAVVGAGSVVTSDIPSGAIAAGIPAKIIKMRSYSPQQPE